LIRLDDADGDRPCAYLTTKRYRGRRRPRAGPRPAYPCRRALGQQGTWLPPESALVPAGAGCTISAAAALPLRADALGHQLWFLPRGGLTTTAPAEWHHLHKCSAGSRGQPQPSCIQRAETGSGILRHTGLDLERPFLSTGNTISKKGQGQRRESLLLQPFLSRWP